MQGKPASPGNFVLSLALFCSAHVRHFGTFDLCSCHSCPIPCPSSSAQCDAWVCESEQSVCASALDMLMLCTCALASLSSKSSTSFLPDLVASLESMHCRDCFCGFFTHVRTRNRTRRCAPKPNHEIARTEGARLLRLLRKSLTWHNVLTLS
jgi:hypothetical protein